MLRRQDRLQSAYVLTWVSYAIFFIVETLLSFQNDTRALPLLLVVAPKIIVDALVFVSISLYMLILVHYSEETPPKRLCHDCYVPTVDVLLPRYKEPWLMYKDTVAAALRLNYPRDKLRIFVCDDGARFPGGSVLLDVARDFDLIEDPVLHVIRRKNGKNAKAGNLNNALKQCSGELVVVFDADHQCHPDFLVQLVPYLLNSRRDGLSDSVAFVQTPQVFFNRDNFLVRLFNGSQLAFYFMAMPALSSKGCTLCVGTGYVMQRRALDEIGGYVEGYAVEDVITALELFKRGWRGTFAHTENPAPLAEGLSPATVKEFFEQRFRWACGSAQLLMYRGLWSANQLTLFQRIAMVTMNYYMFAIPLLFAIAIVRMGLWVLYAYIDAPPPTRSLAMAAQWIPMGVMLILPGIPLLDKVYQMMALFAYMPVYLKIIWLAARGQLNPKTREVAVKASSEAFGNGFPPLAVYNFASPFCFTAFILIAYLGGRVQGITTVAFVLWTWFMNVPVWAGLAASDVKTGDQLIVERVSRPRQRRSSMNLPSERSKKERRSSISAPDAPTPRRDDLLRYGLRIRSAVSLKRSMSLIPTFPKIGDLPARFLRTYRGVLSRSNTITPHDTFKRSTTCVYHEAERIICTPDGPGRDAFPAHLAGTSEGTRVHKRCFDL